MTESETEKKKKKPLINAWVVKLKKPSLDSTANFVF
jgi:hypothetical protein